MSHSQSSYHVAIVKSHNLTFPAHLLLLPAKVELEAQKALQQAIMERDEMISR